MGDKNLAGVPPATWLGAFSEPATERRFREHELESEIAQFRATCLVVATTTGAWGINDIQAAREDGLPLALVLLVRFAIVAYAALCVIFAPRIRSTRSLERFMLLLAALIVFLVFWMDAVRPRDFFTHVGIDVLVLVAIYLVVPLAQPARLLVASAYSAGLILLYVVYKQPQDPLSTTSAVLALIVGNLLGVTSSARHARDVRGQFTLLQRETALRTELQTALGEVKTLTGLLPICAHCKKIRNDGGYWEQVEVYVRDHTHARFSHGLCPDCAAPYHVQLSEMEKRAQPHTPLDTEQ